MKQLYAGLGVIILCICALLQLASPSPLLWFYYTLCCGLACMLCAWGVWYRKFAFLCLIMAAAGLGWQWAGTVGLVTTLSFWNSSNFFSSLSPYIEIRHALILWIIFLILSGLIVWDRWTQSPLVENKK